MKYIALTWLVLCLGLSFVLIIGSLQPEEPMPKFYVGPDLGEREFLVKPIRKFPNRPLRDHPDYFDEGQGYWEEFLEELESRGLDPWDPDAEEVYHNLYK